MADLAFSDWYSWVDAKPGYVVLDGGLGSILSERGSDLLRGSMWSGGLLYTDPEELRAVSSVWLGAGADIITTATYQVSEDLFQKEFDMSAEEARRVISSGWAILDTARKDFWSSLKPSQQLIRRYPKVAVSFGPLSAILEDTNEYSGLYERVSQDDFRCFHHRRAIIFAQHLRMQHKSEIDIICFETIGNLSEAVAIAETMSQPELQDLPYWISFQCRDAFRLASGALLSSAVHAALDACRHRNLVAIGVNCVDIRNLASLIGMVEGSLNFFMASHASRSWRVDTIAYPNSGESWSNGSWVWPLGKPIIPTLWASHARSSAAKIIGGCCRTSPAHVSALNSMRCSVGNGSNVPLPFSVREKDRCL